MSARFFQSRRAAVLSGSAVVALCGIVLLAAMPSSSTDVKPPQSGSGGSQPGQAPPAPGAPGASSSAIPGARPTGGAGVTPSGTSTTAVGGPATTLATGVVPGVVTVENNTNLRDGQAVKVHITAKTGSEIFGFEIRLCAAGATFQFDSDMRPTQSGKCISKPLSPSSDDYQEVRASPPFAVVDTSFRVGVGTDRFVTGTGRAVTITCGPGHPCQIALKIQYPDGFAFRAYQITYA